VREQGHESDSSTGSSWCESEDEGDGARQSMSLRKASWEQFSLFKGLNESQQQKLIGTMKPLEVSLPSFSR